MATEPPAAPSATASPSSGGWLPRIGSWKYHLLLSSVAILLLGPLGGITAAYMNFSLGFFVGGQVLAGILGSVVTYGYGPDGTHGANYMQTMAASVASMAAMGVLTQAMVWLGLPSPPVWQLILYFLCIGMFGVGVGMLYTPMLVDRMQLTYPSGLAVANILRALTDKRLLERSIGQLGGGAGVGFAGSLLAEKVAAFSFLGKIHFSGSTLGAGMVVGARIGVPAIVVGLLGEALTPWLRESGYLGPNDPFRKVGFLVALGTIMGAAAVDLFLILLAASQRYRERRDATAARAESPFREGESVQTPGAGRSLGTSRLAAWVAFWGIAVVVTGVTVMKVPIHFMLFAIVLAFLFVMINGISLGISDSNPISSAFVVSVLLMTVLLGLADAGTGLLAGAVLLVSTSVACDMQQDRSTGWRLGSNRVTQFRYQVIGITMGAVCAVVITKLFMDAYPVLAVNTFDHPEQKVDQWQSAMTYKFVGALQGITNPNPLGTRLLLLGLGIGLATEVVRKLLRASSRYMEWRTSSEGAKAADFVIDAILIPSPYASSFGGFVDLATSLWFGGGGILSSTYNELVERRRARAPKSSKEDLPEDMSTTSLTGGGLIAGESLAALTLGILGLLATTFAR
jgi:uncharacterized oligopeptide transporter (OPT) family protein